MIPAATPKVHVEPNRSRKQPVRTANARDLALVDRIRRGEHGAFDRLHQSYQTRIYAFALKRLRDPSEAEDVAQDVFLEIHRCLHRFEGRSSLQTWIFGIAHNVICRRLRRRGPFQVVLGGELGDVPARDAAIDESVDAARALAACARALETRVSPEQRHAFELRYWDNRSVEAIARRVGKSADAVKVGLLRTRRALVASEPVMTQILS